MMKTILLLSTLFITLIPATAQYSNNFDGPESSLTSNCWGLTDVHTTTTDVITGTGSAITNPPNGDALANRDLITPALVASSTSLDVSFKYKLSAKLSGSATRTIEVGLLDPSGNFTSLSLITLTNASPTTVFDFNQTFTLASTGLRKLVIRTGGGNGSGSARLIFDDLYTNASPLYGTGTCNTAPVATDDMYFGPAGNAVSGNVMTNDSDPNGESMTSVIVATSPDGVVVLNADGSFTFTPNAGFIGTQATFTYQLTDNGFDPATSNIGVVTINYPSLIVLPVKLASFSATLNINDEVEIRWTTASERNASHFEVEKSIDGEHYKTAAMVFAYGNTSELVKYTFTDKDINTSKPTVIYYRIRSVDKNGSSELSAVRFIRITTNDGQLKMQAYPNPVVNELHVTIPSNWQGRKVSFEIFNNNGQLLTRHISTGHNQTEILDMSGFGQGHYVVKAACEAESAYQKIIKY